jgi:hypothetical protein
MGKPKPRNPLGGNALGGSGTKAPKRQQPKKKRRPVQAADGEALPSGNNTDRPSKKAKKSQRSVLGFMVGAASCVALWGFSIVQGVRKNQRDRRVLDSMLRRPMTISEHAACRMDCRFVTRQQIEATLRKGRINDRKSDPTLRPCPKYVVDAELELEGRRSGSLSKAVQAVFAACRTETRVLTVIDTRTNWPCGPC